jgi:hypothetical protein
MKPGVASPWEKHTHLHGNGYFETCGCDSLHDDATSGVISHLITHILGLSKEVSFFSEFPMDSKIFGKNF